jgi:5-methylcytosine-specific restriction enzyme subunit McrC
LKIPILNIYYMLCYAWNRLEGKKIIDLSSIDYTEQVNLYSKVLINGIIHILKRGLHRDYNIFEDELIGIKGKINFNGSLRKLLFRSGKSLCNFDELSYDIILNRILKTTISKLIFAENIDPTIKKELIIVNRRLAGISEINLNNDIFGRLQIYQNNSFYDFLIKLCRLINDSLLVTEKKGRSKFIDFLKDEHKLSRLFEDFVRNFFKLEQNRYNVYSENINWIATSLKINNEKYLPIMITDISLESENRKIIIDTKFYKETLQSHFGKKTIRSEHLYQMFSYLQNVYLGQNKSCEGIILYPTIDEDINLSYLIHGQKISIKTINLNRNWQLIHNDLLAIVS